MNEHDETAAFNAIHNKEMVKRLKKAMKGIYDLRGLRVHLILEFMEGYDVFLRTGQGDSFFEGIVSFREVPRRFRGPKLEIVTGASPRR